MRNTFATRRQRNPGFESGTSREFAEFGNTPDQLAVVWGGDSGIVAASPQVGPGGTFSLDVARFPSDFNLGATLEMRRRNQLGLPPLTQRTVLATVPPNFSERTRLLALDGERLALDEESLSEWLVNAEQQMLLGTDSHPIFETSLEDTTSAIGRLPNGQVTMTEMPREEVNDLRERMRSLVANNPAGSLNLIVETPVRCAARYFLTRLPEGGDVRRPGKESEATAFLLISRAGFSIGLWSPKTGLFSEYSFLAPQELSGDSKTPGRVRKSADSEASPEARLDAYIKQALDQLFLQLSPERLEQMGLSSYAQIVWGCEMGMAERVSPIAREYAEKSGLEFLQIPIPVDEAIASGLLLGSFGFGTAESIGPRVVPVVNLARDLLVQADTEDVERRRLEQLEAQKRRNRTVFAIMAAPVIAFAILSALAADIVRERVFLAYREMQADEQTARLKPDLERRKSYEANLQWYQEFVKQVSLLRRQQGVGTNLLYQLDSNYPFGIDPSFYVSEMKLGQKGEIEIKGLARNKDAIATFLKSLEFAGGSGSGSRLFGNLAYEVQEGVPQVTTSQQGIPTISGSTLTGTNVAPGIVSWTMKGIYLPVAEIAPPDPTAKPGAPAAPGAATPGAAQPPAAQAPAAQTPAAPAR